MHSKRFQYRIGNSFTQAVTLRASDGTAYDLTGATVWYIVKEDEEADASKLWLYWSDASSEGITVADPLTGVAQVSRTAAQMNAAAFDVGIYFWYLRVRTAAGNIYTADTGILDVLPGNTAVVPPA